MFPIQHAMLERISRCNDYERALGGAKLVAFNGHLNRWNNDLQPNQQNNNFFVPTGERITAADIKEAIAFQKSRGLDYLMLRTEQPLARELVDAFGLESETTLVMALLNDISAAWKDNPFLEIRDIQTHNIESDLLDMSDVPEKFRGQALCNMRALLSITKAHPEYHWYCGYLEGKKVANVYALCYDGCIEVDDLWVEKSFRHRHVATTMMKHIAQTLDGVLYLHADAAKTPKEMYARMGFETLKTQYDYYLEWK